MTAGKLEGLDSPMFKIGGGGTIAPLAPLFLPFVQLGLPLKFC